MHSLRNLRRIAGSILLLVSPVVCAQNCGVIVITEIMYDAQGGRADLEYIEIHNATRAPVDLSGWFFSDGVAFTFPPGSWLDGGDYLVVCAFAEVVRETYGIGNAVGNWIGRLDDRGETVELSEANGVVAARVEYDDRDGWPSGAHGTGHSLVLDHVYSEQDNPSSWRISARLGGSPGGLDAAEENPVPVVINEGLLLTGGERWVELFNRSETETFDLEGFYISDESGDLFKSRLPAETRIAPREWLTLTDTELGLDFTTAPFGRTFVSLSHADRSRVIDAHIFVPQVADKSEARIPDGEGSFSSRAEPTRGEANRVAVERDVVINEIMYHPIDNDFSSEFIELLNRGDHPVDLSDWRMTGGIRFTFLSETVIPPGGYLVVARDPERIQGMYGLDASQVVGPDPEDQEAFGRLENNGERVTLRDGNGNIADRVHYRDGGEWPAWADGRGSSLELIDPFQNNGVAAAWDASDDSGKAEVKEFDYDGIQLGEESELHLLLNGRGIALVDDVRVLRREIGLEVSEVLIEIDDEWRYFKGTEAPSVPCARWTELDFDDGDWLLGRTPIGVGEGDEATVLEDLRGNYTTIFCRKEFAATDPGSLQGLFLETEYDDGYAVYLNGVLVAEENVGESDQICGATAAEAREGAQSRVDLSDRLGLLRPGRNVVAVRVHNRSIQSGDLRFNPRLAAGRLVANEGPDLVENGGFEDELLLGNSPGAWLIEGTHVRSGRTQAGALSGAASLKVVATDRGDISVNRLEIALPDLEREATYGIQLRARWVVGSRTLLTHGHGHGFPRSHELAVPLDLGTPGAPNSVTLRRVARTGSFNTGPVISRVRHSPARPGGGEDVEVVARVEDSDGVGSATLLWSLESPVEPDSGELHSVPMTGPNSTGEYGGTIPGQPLQTTVVFYIVAEDTGGRTGRYPADRLERTHPLLLDPERPGLEDQGWLVYRHETPVETPFPLYRFWLHGLNETYLAARRLHSNDLVEGTLVFGDRDVYYGAKIRFTGDPWTRSGWQGSYRVAAPKDRPLHGSIRRFNLENRPQGGRDGRERISNYLIRHNQGLGRVPYSFQWLARWRVDDRVDEVREHVQVPNSEFVRRWYEEDSRGPLFELHELTVFTDAGARNSSRSGQLLYPPSRRTDLPPDDEEQYRWFFNQRRNDGGVDDYRSLIELARIMDPDVTANEEFDELIWDAVDVDEFLRVWAIRMNTDDWNTWGMMRWENAYLFRPEGDGRWVLIPWDMELSYGSVESFLPPGVRNEYPNRFSEVQRLINRPRAKRLFYGILNEMVNRQFNSEFLAPYREKLQEIGIQRADVLAPGGYIDRRNALLRTRIESALEGSLTVTTNDGLPFPAKAPLVEIEGLAPVNLVFILVLVNGEIPPGGGVVRFSDTDPFAWRIVLSLPPGVNELDVLGFDITGALIDTTSIEVTVDPGTRFLRGDADLSGRINVTDAVRILLYLFRGVEIPCRDAADADDSGGLNLTDAVFVFRFLFAGGPEPRDPFPSPGLDPTADALGCRRGLE